MCLGAPGHARRSRHPLDTPVGEGDRGVEPAEQLRFLAGAGARVAERIERSAKRLSVGFKHGVHQPQTNGIEAAGLGLEPRDSAEKRA